MFFSVQRVKFKTEALLAVGTSPLDDVMPFVKIRDKDEKWS